MSENNYISVSYTHLDVYKRQPLYTHSNKRPDKYIRDIRTDMLPAFGKCRIEI